MLKQLKVSHKMVLLICGVALPLLGAIFFATIKDFNQDIHFAQQQQKGVAYQRPLQALLEAIPQHQWLVEAARRDTGAARNALFEKQIEIEQHFAELEKVHARVGADLEFTEAGLARRQRAGFDPASVKGNWGDLKKRHAGLTATGSAEAHRAIQSALRQMIAHAGDTSGLRLDSDLATHYLVETTLLALPQTQDRLASLITTSQKLSASENLIPDPKTQLAAQAAALQESDVDRVNAALTAAQRETAAGARPSETLQKSLTNPLQAFNGACEEFLSQIQTATQDPATANAEALQAAGQKAQRATLNLWQAAAGELDQLLAKRLGALRQSRLLTLGAVALALVVALAVAVLVSRSITRPLAGLTQATQRILRGEYTVRAPVNSEDEIGILAGSFNAMVEARNKNQGVIEAENKRLQASIQELLVVVSEASDGKLDVRAKVSEGALGNVSDALNLMLENVGGLIANAKVASDQVAAASTGITTVAQELEKGEQRQTQEIFITSEGVRDLNGKAQKVLANCQTAKQAADKGRQAAEQGAKAVREVKEKMARIRENTQANAKKLKRLGDRSLEIAGIVKVIADISAKTDMLALNASIEAVRAGEQGRGFTIVAEQVRGLADRTKTLTSQIERLVSDIQQETAEAVAQMETQTQEVESGARAAESAGNKLDNIVAVSTQSAELVAEINDSASQQAARAQEMLATVEAINQVVAESAVKVRETRSTSEQLLTLSSELNRQLAQFQVAATLAEYDASNATQPA